MSEKICSFFGHRNVDITEQLTNLATAEILKAIEYGCSIFYFGRFSDFDNLCYEIVLKIKQENPSLNLKLLFCVPLEKDLRKLPRDIREEYDDVIFIPPSFTEWYKSLYFRNCAMIDESDYVIFYVTNTENSGANKALTYAKKQKDKFITNLGEAQNR